MGLFERRFIGLLGARERSGGYCVAVAGRWNQGQEAFF